MENNTIKWLYAVPEKKKLYILMLMLVHALNGASGVLYALFLRNIVDSASFHDENKFWYFVICTIILVLFQVMIRAIIRWLNELSKSTFENIFKNRLMNNLLFKDYSNVSAIHSGEWLNRLTNDTVVVAENYVEILPGLVGMIVKLISAIVMLIILDWHFACILVPGGLILLLFTYLFRKVLKRLHKNVQEKDGKLRIFLQEHISSMLIVRSFAVEEEIAKEANNKMNEHKFARMKKNHFSNICNIGFGIAMNGMYLFGICYCANGILIESISFGTLTAITQLITQIQTPFANITGYLPKYYAMIASAERLMEIESIENDNFKIHDIKKIKEYYSKQLKSFGLKNANFAYYNTTDDLKNISKDGLPLATKDFSIEINKGEYVVFTGHSGCGKSTLLKLLMSIYKLDSGERFIKEKDNSIKELSVEWRRLFAYVPQGNQLLSGTIREIVSFADKTDLNNDDRIYKALKIACADKFVSELEHGIDTVLGERGTGLSEGQMQRLAIARAIFSESPILLLDEVTSALDENTEKQLLKNLKSMTDKTVVIVTHRPEVFKICDRVIDFLNK